MDFRVRLAAATAVVALLGGALTGCSLFGLEEDPPLECAGETPPESVPGDAGVLLTIAEGKGAWDLTTVVYDDGTVAILEGTREAASASADGASTGALTAMGGPPRTVHSPYDDQPGAWYGGYLLPCALTELRSLADDALTGSPEYGQVAITDKPWTYVRYDNGATRVEVEVYAFDTGYTEGLDWSERRARERLAALTHFLATNLVGTQEELPVTSVQVDGSGEVGDGFEWPGPALAELLGDQGCGVLSDDQATAVLAFARDPGLGEAASELTVRALPPGVSGCQ